MSAELLLDQDDVVQEPYEPPCCEQCELEPAAIAVCLNLRTAGMHLAVGVYCPECAAAASAALRLGRPERRRTPLPAGALMRRDFYVDVARDLLRHLRLEDFIGDDGRPTEKCWDRVKEGTLSGGEQAVVAVAMAILDYSMPAVMVIDLLRLDDASLAAVGHALVLVAEQQQ